MLTSRILAADGTLVRVLENSRDFRLESAKISVALSSDKALSFRAERGMERMGRATWTA